MLSPTEVQHYQKCVELIRHLRYQNIAEFVCTVSGNPTFDLMGYYQFLKQNRLREFVFSVAEQHSILTDLPDALSKKLHHYIAYSRQRRESLLNVQQTAMQLLQNHSIPCLLLKGPAITSELYSGPMYRHQGDVDLLVRESQAQEAYSVLLHNGFYSKRNRLRLNRTRILRTHAVELRFQDYPLDLHWALRRGPEYHFEESEIWNNLRSVEENGSKLSTISIEHQLLMQLLSLVHNLGRGGVSLKEILDMSLAVEKFKHILSSKKFWEDRRQESVEDLCIHALILTNTIFPQQSDTGPISSVIRASQRNQTDHYTQFESTCQLAWNLVTESRGSIESLCWILRVHRPWTLRKVSWLLKRILPNYRRLPLLLIRTVKLLWQFTCRTISFRKWPPR